MPIERAEVEAMLDQLRGQIQGDHWAGAPIFKNALPKVPVRDALPTASELLAYRMVTLRGTPDVTYQCLRTGAGVWEWLQVSRSDRIQTLPVPASGFVSPSTNGAVDGTTHGTNHSYATKDFATGTEQHADYDFTIPDEYDGGNITVEFSWTAASGSGTVSWELNVASGADSDVLDAAKTDVGSATDTLITAGDIHKISMTWSTNLPTAGDLVTIRVSRDVAADNLGVDALLKEVKFRWGAS